MIRGSNNNAWPLIFVERDNSIGLSNVAGGRLGARRVTLDEGADCAEGTPGTREII